MPIIQYPYQLQVLSQAEGGFDDSTGQWVPESSEYVAYCACRDEAGNGKPIMTVDGQERMYSFLVQMPKGVEAIAPGTSVQVIDDSNVIRVQGKVLFSRKDQLHTRAWI